MIAIALSPHKTDLEQISKFSVNNIELKFWSDFMPTRENVRKVEKSVKGYDFNVVSSHLPNYHINKRKEDVEQMKKAIGNILTCFDAKIFVMHCLYGNREVMVENLKILDEWLDKNEIFLAIENLRSKGANLRTPGDLQYMHFEEFSNIGFCLDTSHVVDIDDLWIFLKHASHMHISDFNNEEVHLPLGSGVVDWKRFFKESRSYTGYFVIEYLSKYLTKKNIDKTLEILRKYGAI